MKTSELTGPALDWAVVKLEYPGVTELARFPGLFLECHECGDYTFSTDWSQGGPILEREKVTLKENSCGHWFAKVPGGTWVRGSSPLIAVCRCYVASKLGGEVELPEELK